MEIYLIITKPVNAEHSVEVTHGLQKSIPLPILFLSVTFQKIVNPWISLLSSLAHKVFFITLLHFATLKKAKLDLLFFI